MKPNPIHFSVSLISAFFVAVVILLVANIHVVSRAGANSTEYLEDCLISDKQEASIWVDIAHAKRWKSLTESPDFNQPDSPIAEAWINYADEWDEWAHQNQTNFQIDLTGPNDWQNLTKLTHEEWKKYAENWAESQQAKDWNESQQAKDWNESQQAKDWDLLKMSIIWDYCFAQFLQDSQEVNMSNFINKIDEEIKREQNSDSFFRVYNIWKPTAYQRLLDGTLLQ